MTVAEAVDRARRDLAGGNAGDGGAELRREARRLVALASGLAEVEQLTFPDRELEPSQLEHLAGLVARRRAGVPFAYLAGRREFAGLELVVDERVLVPRPETEHLVEVAVGLLQGRARPRVLDLGVGSGAVAIAIAVAVPQARVVAVDVEAGAAVLARHNIARHGLATRVAVVVGDWAEGLDTTGIDLVVSNPPYLAPADPEVEAGVRCFEPARALWGGETGLEVISRLLASLERSGCSAPLCCEIGARQGPEIERLVASFRRRLVAIEPDLAGWPRVAVITAQDKAEG